MPTSEIAVVDEADDLLGASFARWAAGQGVPVVRHRLAGAARAMTVVVAGGRVEVSPAWSLLLRPLRSPEPPASPDTRFGWSEAFATLWAAAALSGRPVVNRPDAWGWLSGLSASIVRNQRRAGLPVPAAEAYWHQLPPPGGYRYHQDLDTRQTAGDPAMIRFGRSRALPATRGWEQVVVVGGEGFRVISAGAGDPDPVPASLAVADRLSLSFATVSWAVPAGPGPAVLAQVNPFPTLHECRPVICQVFPALLRRLLG